MAAKFKVLYATNSRACLLGNIPEGGRFAINTHYHVATVTCESHEDVFRLMNHITDYWWNNEEVEKVHEDRSMCVGDILLENNGRAWYCNSIGWVQIDALGDMLETRPEVNPITGEFVL